MVSVSAEDARVAELLHEIGPHRARTVVDGRKRSGRFLERVERRVDFWNESGGNSGRRGHVLLVHKKLSVLLLKLAARLVGRAVFSEQIFVEAPPEPGRAARIRPRARQQFDRACSGGKQQELLIVPRFRADEQCLGGNGAGNHDKLRADIWHRSLLPPPPLRPAQRPTGKLHGALHSDRAAPAGKGPVSAEIAKNSDGHCGRLRGGPLRIGGEWVLDAEFGYRYLPESGRRGNTDGADQDPKEVGLGIGEGGGLRKLGLELAKVGDWNWRMYVLLTSARLLSEKNDCPAHNWKKSRCLGRVGFWRWLGGKRSDHSWV